MRNFYIVPARASRLRRFLGASLTALALALFTTAACDDRPEFTVGGQKLKVTETEFGAADYFCSKLANGQFMVVMTDFLADGGDTGREMPVAGVCEQTKSMMNSRQIFHSYSETNMRLVFPRRGWTKIPPQTTFTVGPSNCTTTSGPDTQALAYFSHHTEGTADYTVNKQAESGKITVNHPGVDASTTIPEKIAGSFDLNFGADHITGNFEALYCSGIAPGLGD